MSNLEVIEVGDCPNGHGEMVFFNNPIDILYYIPEDLMEPLEGVDTPLGMYGYIAAICQECGFTLSLEKITNQPKYIEWLKEFRASRKRVVMERKQTGWNCKPCGIWYPMSHKTGEICPVCESKMGKTFNPTEEELQTLGGTQ